MAGYSACHSASSTRSSSVPKNRARGLSPCASWCVIALGRSLSVSAPRAPAPSPNPATSRGGPVKPRRDSAQERAGGRALLILSPGDWSRMGSADHRPPDRVSARRLGPQKFTTTCRTWSPRSAGPRDLAIEGRAAAVWSAPGGSTPETSGDIGSVEREATAGRAATPPGRHRSRDRSRQSGRPSPSRRDHEAGDGHRLAVDEVVHRDEIDGRRFRPVRTPHCRSRCAHARRSLPCRTTRREKTVFRCRRGRHVAIEEQAPSGAKNCSRVPVASRRQ